jgi:hypothetical protein
LINRIYLLNQLFSKTTCGALLTLAILSGCTSNSNLSQLKVPDSSSSPSPTPTATSASGPRSAKFFFKTTVNGGSFDTPSSLGTAASPGSGTQATKVFNADGTILGAAGPSGAGWPAWIKSFEIGVSGLSNASSENSHCANFAESTESTTSNCNVGPSPSPSPAKCGAPSGLFRVSEVDCTLGNPAATEGNGGPSDGVYFRIEFSRDTNNLGLAENILVTLEYVVSALNPAPSNPTNCFSSTDGSFSPEACSDFVWRAYLKHSTSEIVQPFLLLVPPTYSSILAAGQTAPTNAGTGVVAKQFVIPLAGDSTLTTLQISRTKSAFPSSSNLRTYCTAAGTLPGDSPLCAGIVFYSITFFRI